MIIANTNQQIASCFDLMLQLRSKIVEEEFVDTVLEMQQEGYVLGYLEHENRPVALAGFRKCINFAAGGTAVYIYDLVTREGKRSLGYGAKIISSVEHWAAQQGCQLVHLDSGIFRYQAHKFYHNNNYFIMAHHFYKPIGSDLRRDIIEASTLND